MKRKSYEGMLCPIARTLERVGEWWSILILRDAMTGITRFEDFQKHLGISPNMLSRRLSGLVDTGFLERHLYSESPPRMEYRLTERGHAFEPILMTFAAFGSEQFSDPAKPGPVVTRRKTGRQADVRVVDAHTGQVIDWANYVFTTPPAPLGVKPKKAKAPATLAKVPVEARKRA